MPNALSPELLAQLFSQESNDPFLMLLTLNHPDWPSTYYFVNNGAQIISRGLTFLPFPMTIVLPTDDGESSRSVKIEFDNVSLDLIDILRSVTSPMTVKLEMILASLPDIVQMELTELQIQNVNYNSKKVSAILIIDSFLNTELSSERYTPSAYPGLF